MATLSRSCSDATAVQPTGLRPLLLSIRAPDMGAAGCRSSVDTAARWPRSSAGPHTALHSTSAHITSHHSSCASSEQWHTRQSAHWLLIMTLAVCRDRCHFCPPCHARFSQLCVPIVGVNRLRVWQYQQCASLSECMRSIATLPTDVSQVEKESIAASYRSTAVLKQPPHSTARTMSAAAALTAVSHSEPFYHL